MLHDHKGHDMASRQTDAASDHAPDTPAASRSEFQWVAEGATLLVMVLAPLGALLDGLDLVTGGTALVELPATDTTIAVGAQNVSVDSVMANLQPTMGQAWALTAVGAVQAVVIAAIAWMLHRILTRARSLPGPFAGGTSRALFRLAGAIAIGGTVVVALNWVAPMMLSLTTTGSMFEFSFAPIFLGAFAGVVGEIFRRGEAMQDDLAGLV